mgnify:CR=1 FL=1
MYIIWRQTECTHPQSHHDTERLSGIETYRKENKWAHSVGKFRRTHGHRFLITHTIRIRTIEKLEPIHVTIKDMIYMSILLLTGNRLYLGYMSCNVYVIMWPRHSGGIFYVGQAWPAYLFSTASILRENRSYLLGIPRNPKIDWSTQ